MSHFYTIVLVKKDQVDELTEENVKGAVDAQMAPFNENDRVDPYQRACWCVGNVAKQDARRVAEAAVPLGEQRNKLDAWLKKEHPEVHAKRENHSFSLNADEDYLMQQKWDELLKVHNDAEKAAYGAHVLSGKPDPGCAECQGSGKETTTYNPDSKWDWYRVGGRWDGALTHVEVDDGDGGFNFGDQHTGIERNVMSVEDLLQVWVRDTDTPYSLLTPNGDWVEKGTMGWFGTSCGDMAPEDWRDRVVKLLEAHKDCYAVGVDCHI